MKNDIKNERNAHTYLSLISIYSHKFAALILVVALIPHFTFIQLMFIFILNKCILCMMRAAFNTVKMVK